MSKPHPRRLRVALLAVTAIVLSACGTAPGPKPTTVITPPTGETEEQTTAVLTLPPSVHSSVFAATESALEAHDWMAAESNLAALDTAELSPTDWQYRQYLQARSAYLRGQQAETALLLEQAGAQSLHPLLDRKIYRFEQHLAELEGSYLEAAAAADRVVRTEQAPSVEQLHAVWHNLKRCDEQRLQQARQNTADTGWAGWLDLAALTAPTVSPELRRSALSQWQLDFPQHPANGLLPDLNTPYSALHSKPQRIALLLPLSGKLAPAARAIRDGYLAAHYATPAPRPALQIMDSNRYASAPEAYQQAVADGAELIIGPLAKSRVAQLQGLIERPVPIIALNRGDSLTLASDTASPLLQLSLAAEDEVRAIADTAFSTGARSALIIRPSGSRSDKLESALRQRWQALGGQIVATASYSAQGDYSSAIKSALALPASEQRARDIRQILAAEVEQMPRRRQDIDSVFLLARNAAQARSIKPLLAYHYAGSLPIYATSAIYSGRADPRDRDLNGIQFVDLPWLLNGNGTLEHQLADSGQQPRLNALGAEAYRLQQALPVSAITVIAGHTGILTIDSLGQVHREPTPVKFDRGILQPLALH